MGGTLQGGPAGVPPVVLRPLRAGETGLLERATLANMNWCGPRFVLADVRARGEFSHYTVLDPGRGDLGVVAEAGDGRALGVAWLVFLGADDPGYGYVADGVPELSVCVLDDADRGSGLGRALIEAVLVAARSRGVGAVSLSVEEPNPAAHLYARLGFVPTTDPGTMLRSLTGAVPTG